MVAKETSLQKYSDRLGNFNPISDIAAWVHIDQEKMADLRTKLNGVEDDGFKMVDNALILDIPVDLLDDRKKWEEKVDEYLKPIKSSAGNIGEVGVVRVHPCLVGDEKKPFVAVFFSARIDRPTDPTDTDYILMYSVPINFKYQNRPQSWGLKKQIPIYTGKGGYGKPEIQHILG